MQTDTKNSAIKMEDIVRSLYFMCIVKTANNNILCYTTSDSEVYYNTVIAKKCLDFTQIQNSLLTQNANDVNLTLFGQILDDDLIDSSVELKLIGTDTAPGELTLFSGFITKQTVLNKTTILSIAPIYQKLQRSIGDFFSESCRAELGDRRCLVDLTKYTYHGNVTAVINKRTIKGSQTIPDGQFFVNGVIEFDPTPNSNGQRFKTKIVNQEGNILYFLLPTPFEILENNTFTIITGCNKLFKTCRDKFSNIVNFRGEPFLNGKILKSVTKEIGDSNSNKK
ncbi:MAG: phage BR0599 family protein [Alphaproteobacteria bacterium]|nr:phage BR0599 family protein [Rickettsiales bacterium]